MFILYLGAFMTLMQISFSLHAEDLSAWSKQANKDTIWTKMDSKSGLIISLPASSPGKLKEELAKTNSKLQMLKSTLTRTVEEKRFTLEDGFISAVMPGGLVYAAIIQHWHRQAVSRLNDVNRQLDELSGDLDNLRAGNARNTLLALAQ